MKRMLLPLLVSTVWAIGTTVAAQPAGWQNLFDGKTLAGWDGHPDFWSVEDGAITGRTTAEKPTKGNTFLIWRGGEPGDFELEAEFLLSAHNSGIQYRSFETETRWVVGGYQADMDFENRWTGINYGERFGGILVRRGERVTRDERGQRRVEKRSDPAKLAEKIRPGEWNRYHIIAKGRHLIHKINGVVMSELIDDSAGHRSKGLLALQLHAGPPMKVQFRNLFLKDLGPASSTGRSDEEPEVRTEVATPVKVMSFNIRYGTARDGENRWDKRSYLVAETIRMFDPDLLGAQEVLAFQAEWLKQSFPGYGFHGVGRADGAAGGEYVPVLYKKDRFEVVDSGHFWLSETPDVAGSKSWDSSLPRMVSWVHLRDLKNRGATLAVLNTHFDHRGRQARLESARLIRKRSEQLMAQGVPFIVTGDFNTTEDGRPHATLVSGSEENEIPILDSFRVANPERGPHESTVTRWVGHRKGLRIDWILHSREFTTLQSTINHTHEGRRYPSDHYPVQAVLRMKK